MIERTLTKKVVVAAGLFLALITSPAIFAQAPLPDSPAIESRVAGLLQRMTLEQKIDLLGGVDNMYIREFPVIGWPRLKMSDGPMGVRTWGPSNSYAGGVALAASWDPALAYRIGKQIGLDARSRGVHIMLGPGVNIYRAPMGGRNFEYFGEDPFLASQLAVFYIEGVQDQGVMATIKHFAANNQEYARHDVSSDIDERTLREIYLPAFEAAVKVAHVASIMDAYNPVNGKHATQNAHLNDEIARGEWGFDGFIMSDWGATVDGVAAANGGLDLEMPDGWFMNRKTLTAAIEQGKVSVATIDEKVRRILRKSIEFGFLDRDQTDFGIPIYRMEARQTALDSALESMVLLKNQGAVLPLDRKAIHTLAVIGPEAWPAVPGGGGSSQIVTFAPVDLYTGIANDVGDGAKVFYSRGLPSPEELFKSTQFTSDAGTGLTEEVFADAMFHGKPVRTEQVEHLSTPLGRRVPAELPAAYSIRRTGTFVPSVSGRYLALMACGAHDHCKLYLDDKLVLDADTHEIVAPGQSTFVEMAKGHGVSVRMEQVTRSEDPVAGLGLRAVDNLVPIEARKLAEQADAVVLAVGFDAASEFEGMDRSFALPPGQDELIRTIASLNKRTIVSLTAGGNVDMHAWLDAVPALIHNWYPGQEGGAAFARILFGQANPEGKLPVSFERSWQDNPVRDSYYPAKGSDRVSYKEGVFVGYRHYATSHAQPLFPFGFGLSYTTFEFRNLHIAPQNVAAGEDVVVSFDVVNTGDRRGAEVAQLYVGDPSARVPRPAIELKGFKKVWLDPGKSEHVVLNLDHRALSYYDVTNHRWQADPGRFTIAVGNSSANLTLHGEFVLGDTASAAELDSPPFEGHASRGWEKTFSDDFNGDALNKCWKTSYIDNVHTLEGNGEQEWYAEPGDGTGFNPFHLENGVLSISAVPTLPAVLSKANGLPYLSGMIMNDGCFRQTYGYFQIKARMPQGAGLWPAFWLLPAAHHWPPEIDVFEMFGAPNSRREGGMGLVHTGTVGGGSPDFNNWHRLSIDQYASFHTYGLLWGPKTMTVYVDGVAIATQETPARFHEPMYMVANLAVGGHWPEAPEGSTRFPAVLQIDSIEAWQYLPWTESTK